MASVVSEKFCSLILIKHLLVPGFPPSRLTIGVSERGRLVPAMQIDDIISVVSWAR
jgi:hypothetical protein